MIRLLCGALVALLALAPPAFGGEEPAAARDAGDYVPGRLVVHVEPGQALPADLLAGLGVTRRSGTRMPGVSTLELPERAVQRVQERLARDPRVSLVERDFVVRAAEVTPNDVLWSQQWGPRKIDAPKVWAETTGAPIVVAVLDTGVDPTHPELLGRVRPGRSFVTPGLTTLDDNGHGTQVAGVMAATGDNLLGLAGMCWTCEILPVKVLDHEGLGTTTQLAEGIRWATDNGAQIINLSLGADRSPKLLDDAVAHAHSKDVLLIAAAGNSNTSQEFFPAADSRVLSVGATNDRDQRYDFSNHSWVEVAAPGCNMATLPGGLFTPQCFLGTSSASPLVAGAAALMFAHNPSLGSSDVRAALEDTAVPVSGFVHGRIDAFAAFGEIADLAKPEPELEPEPEPEPVPLPPVLPAEPEPEPEPQAACAEDRVPDSGFRDIRGNTHELPINCIVWYGVAQGVSADRYGPGLSVTRAQMASFIARALERAGLPLSASGDHFDDIGTSPHRDNINKLANAGVVQGTGHRTYSPNAQVRRDQMASFLVRAYELASNERLQASGSHFDDTRGNVHEPNINKAAEAELVRGTAQRTYSPSREVRRDQMGSFIARTLERLVARGHMQPN